MEIIEKEIMKKNNEISYGKITVELKTVGYSEQKYLSNKIILSFNELDMNLIEHFYNIYTDEYNKNDSFLLSICETLIDNIKNK